MDIRTVKTIVVGIWSSRSILRSAFYHELSSAPALRGRILDLGSKSKQAGYYEFLNIEDMSQVTTCDLSERADVQADLERVVPFEAEEFANVLCFNLLEHIFNYQDLADEMRRLLKTGGYVIGFAPFLMKIHGDPEDYFRYSGPSLERIFKEAGFEEVSVRTISYGPASCAYHQIEFLLPRIIRTVMVSIPVFIDAVLTKLRPDVVKDRYPFGYVFVCKKLSND